MDANADETQTGRPAGMTFREYFLAHKGHLFESYMSVFTGARAARRGRGMWTDELLDQRVDIVKETRTYALLEYKGHGTEERFRIRHNKSGEVFAAHIIKRHPESRPYRGV